MSAVKAVSPLDKVRHAYAHDGDVYDPGIDCTGYYDADGVWVDTPTLAKQSSKDECDINVMMAKYQATGVFENVNEARPQWGDFADVPSYQEAQNLLLDSQRQFAALSAEVRARFGNDPKQMLAFLSDEGNRAEAIELGLVDPPPPEPAPQKVVVVDEEGRGDASPPKGGGTPPVAS